MFQSNENLAMLWTEFRTWKQEIQRKISLKIVIIFIIHLNSWGQQSSFDLQLKYTV